MADLEQLLLNIKKYLPENIISRIAYSELILELDANNLLNICLKLRDIPELQFSELIDVCAVDYLTYGVSEWSTDDATAEGFSRGVGSIPATNQFPQRFAVVYHLLSIQHNQRIRLKVFAPGEPPTVPSVMSIWQSADWYEREAFDLFGVIFTGHPDLRRILTDYGFIGHPFRKDFPLIGQVEMRYDAAAGRVVYEPVSIKPRTLVPKVIRYVGHDEAS